MKVNHISTHTQNFGGVAILAATREFSKGFPYNPDSIDYFQYIPFKDDTEETIEKEMNMFRALNEGPKPFEIESGKFIMKESATDIIRRKITPLRTCDYKEYKWIFPRATVNIFELPEYELKSKIAYLKRTSEKILMENMSDKIVKCFRWK